MRDEVTVLRKTLWPDRAAQKFEAHMRADPNFYAEELQDWLRAQHPNLKKASEATTFQAFNFDLRLTIKS